MDTAEAKKPASPSPIWRVFRYCRPYPGMAVGTFLCAFISTLAAVAYPPLTGRIINELVAGTDVSHLLLLAGILAGTFFARDFLNSVRIRLNNSFEQNVIYDIRGDLYARMQKLPLPWFDRQATGDLITRVSEDVTNMERVLIDGIEQGSVAMLQLVAVGIMMFYAQPTLAAWTLVPIPLMLVGAWLYTTTAHQRYRIQRKAASALNSTLLDNLQGMRQIRAFAREDEEMVHFQEKAEGVRQGTLVVMRAWATYQPAMSFFASLGTVIVLFFGVQIMRQDPTFAIGDLFMFVLYVNMFYDPINRLHGLNQMIQSGRAASERVFRILDTPAEVEPITAVQLPARKAGGRKVEFTHVAFSYRDDVPVLKEITLTAEPGQTIALVGPTGAGKSSLINLIPRFYVPTRGTVRIDGVPNEHLSLRELRDEIGVVTQESFLFNDTVLNNLRFGRPNATLDEIEFALKAANAWDFVQRMPEKLQSVVGERGVRLSVGEKQRISIARALLKDPPILILDEATASVDTQTERLIQEALDRLMSERTSFVIAHRLSTVRNADLICVIQHGEIIEQGDHESLYAQGGLYAKLCAIQHGQETIEEVFERINPPAPAQPAFQ